MNLDDFLPEKPYITEARRWVKTYREGVPGTVFTENEVIKLMADYASETWREGYEEGRLDGVEEGYSNGYLEADNGG